MEVTGVCICLFFSFTTAIYKHKYSSVATSALENDAPSPLSTNVDKSVDKEIGTAINEGRQSAHLLK